jgi:hypothetical protein
MGLSMINEKELGKAIVDNLAPQIVQAQTRLEGWAESFLLRLLQGNEVHVSVPLGDRVCNLTITMVPSPKP